MLYASAPDQSPELIPGEASLLHLGWTEEGPDPGSPELGKWLVGLPMAHSVGIRITHVDTISQY
jgi:hypothetical protein